MYTCILFYILPINRRCLLHASATKGGGGVFFQTKTLRFSFTICKYIVGDRVNKLQYGEINNVTERTDVQDYKSDQSHFTI